MTLWPPEPHRSREELLGIVRQRTSVLRRRRVAKATGVMALVVAVLGGGAVYQGSLGDGRSLKVTAAGQGADQPGSPPTSAAPSTTTTVGSTAAPAPARPTTSTSRPTTSTTVPVTGAAPTTTTTVAPPVCRNSSDPRCGPFRWDPEPVKGTMNVSVLPLTESPRAGQPVDFRVVVDNPDTGFDHDCFDQDDGNGGGLGCMANPSCPPAPDRYGPWSPPEKGPDHYETTKTFSYDQPGTYTVRFTYRTFDGCGRNPYSNEGTGTATVTIRPGTTTTSSTSTTTTSSSTTTTTRPKGRPEG